MDKPLHWTSNFWRVRRFGIILFFNPFFTMVLSHTFCNCASGIAAGLYSVLLGDETFIFHFMIGGFLDVVCSVCIAGTLMCLDLPIRSV